MSGKGKLPPYKFKYVRRILKNPSIAVLDIGCGNNSPTLTKRWFPGCVYHGVDIQTYNNTDEDLRAIDRFFLVNKEGDGYDEIPDSHYDLVMMSHVIEHMADPWPLLSKICHKLKPGGYIWIAFPSVRSLSFPSAHHSLHYCDDDTHVRIIDIAQVANTLLDNGVKVVHAGRSKDIVRSLVGLVALPLTLVQRAVGRAFYGPRMWFLYGFEDHVFGQRRDGLNPI